jgi:hypothetical protein
VDVGLELDDGLGGEDVRNDLPLARVVGPVACVEQAALDADEDIVEGPRVLVSDGLCASGGCCYSRLQHAVTMAQDGLDGVVVGDADMVWLYPDHWTELVVHVIDGQISPSSPDGVKQP